MAVPLDAVRAIHNAFRKDLAAMDAAANAAVRQGGSLDPVLNRYKLFNEVLVWHAAAKKMPCFRP